MNIETIEGNLLDFPSYCKTNPDKYIGISSIAHSCNCETIMGGGIARQIKSRYPQAYEADIEFHTRREHKTLSEFSNALGEFSKTEVNSKFLPDGKGLIYNMYTQVSVGTESRQVNYEKFWQALKKIEEDLYKMNVEKHEYDPSAPPVLGLPYGISCGLAGGNWKIIKAVIEDIFLDSPIKCYIVKLDI